MLSLKKFNIKLYIMKTDNKNKEIIRNVIKKMVSDKKSISDYIRKNGSLKGFSNAEIEFAKPL